MNYHISFDLDFRRNSYPGKFIVLEGIDGCGKTTQVNKVSEELRNKGINVFATKEPTDGLVGQMIRRVIKKDIKLPTRSIQYLFAADRAAHLEEIIVPKLKEGETIISDRYFWSSVAYGLADLDGASEKNRLLIVQSMLSFYHQFIVPDFTFYLQISAQTAETRLSQMHKQRELYERRAKLEKIKSGYERLVEQFPKEITVIDGERLIEEITEEILKKINKLQITQ